MICLVGHAPSLQAQVPDDAEQVIVVTTPDWSASKGVLTRFNRDAVDWVKVGDSIPIAVGHTGLGWGLGVHPIQNQGGPVKTEGDGRAPAGLFEVGTAFGRDAVKSRLPFIKTTP